MTPKISMLPPMTNLERQRKFQAAHPGYDRRRKARERARGRQIVAAWRAQQQAAAAEQHPAPTPAE